MLVMVSVGLVVLAAAIAFVVTLWGMWIIRPEGWRDDVMRVHGSVPAEISARFYADQRHRGR